jgi:transcriptional regulator with XRE-family HTH domain
MKLTIGNKIKSLRKKHNLTQEQLAEQLGITFQSISKWENDIALPDITLVPTIAAFFGISIDELFDYNLKDINDKVEAICKEVEDCRYREDFAKAREILQEGLKNYPNNELLLNNYLYTINYKDNPDETISIAGKLAAETSDASIRYDALRFLSYAYQAKGELEYAKATLEQIPQLYFTRLSEMAFLLKGEEKFEAANKQKWISCETLLQMSQKLFEYYISIGDKDKAVGELDAAIKVIDIFKNPNFDNYRSFFSRQITKVLEEPN